MHVQDAAAYAQLMDTRDRIAGDASRSWYERARDIGSISGPMTSGERRSSTVGDVLRVAIGSALGYGLGRGASSVLGLSDDKANAVAFTGAMAGGLMGLNKSASESRLAFRAAFIKSAIDAGYFKQAFLAPLVLTPMTGLSGVANRIGESVGAIAGSADAPDEIDKDIVQAQVEAELLRQEEARAKALRQNALLKKVLAKRMSQRK